MRTFIEQNEDYKKMTADGKIGLVATIDDEGEPHISFLSSIQPIDSTTLTVGQFCEGLSKRFFHERTKIGFLFFTAQMEIWHGRADYFQTKTIGPEFDMYNNKPLFRYNTYFGIGQVHYFKLKDISEKTTLSMGDIVKGALLTKVVAPFQGKNKQAILNHHAKRMFSQIDGLKFMAHLDDEGYPVITPIIQAANAGSDRIVFSGTPFAQELKAIPCNIKSAILFVNLKMESVLVKGTYAGLHGLIPSGRLDIERVYNSMPPFAGYIYPKQAIKKVEVF